MTTLDERICDLVAHAYANAPAIKQIFDGAGLSPADVQSVADLAKVPVTSKDRLVEIHQQNPPFGGFLAIDPDDLPRIYISPGPIYDPQPRFPEAEEFALDIFRYVGLGRGDRVLNTFMYHLTPAGILLDDGIRGVGATVLPTGPGNTELQIMMMMALKATGFVGQPSYLATILDKCAEMGIPKEAVPIKKAVFSAEPYLPVQQQRFEGEYGMRTTSAFGTADLGFIGYTVHGVPGFCVGNHIHIEIVDPSTGQPLPAGETGELVVTTFNRAYPLIRFGTGDLSAIPPQPDPRLNGKQQIMGLFGRSGEAIKVRGMFLHPSQLRAALIRFPMIKNLQAVITRPENKDVVTVKIELHTGNEPGNIAQELQQLAEQAIRLRIDHVEFVEEGVIKAGDRAVKDERNWN